MKSVTVKHYVAFALLVLTFFGNAFASNEGVTVTDSFEIVETKQLDKALVYPEFDPRTYKTVAVKWTEFDYRPIQQHVKRLARNGHYELTEEEKNKLEDKANTIFEKQLTLLKNYQLIDLAQANAETIIVQLTLTDFVNKVPNNSQRDGIQVMFLRQFGAATLDIALLDGGQKGLLFKGYVREDIEATGYDLALANTITARRETTRQLQRWAKGLRNSIDDLK
jgi:Asp-tRNA(Asn)/Glu-tRNA(Gln) amidotransferase C subunit